MLFEKLTQFEQVEMRYLYTEEVEELRRWVSVVLGSLKIKMKVQYFRNIEKHIIYLRWIFLKRT
jgi:hypothetical protein